MVRLIDFAPWFEAGEDIWDEDGGDAMKRMICMMAVIALAISTVGARAADKNLLTNPDFSAAEKIRGWQNDAEYTQLDSEGREVKAGGNGVAMLKLHRNRNKGMSQRLELKVKIDKDTKMVMRRAFCYGVGSR